MAEVLPLSLEQYEELRDLVIERDYERAKVRHSAPKLDQQDSRAIDADSDADSEAVCA